MLSPGIQGRSIVLIGGAGLIGHHLALELARAGAVVQIIDALLNYNPSSSDGLYPALIRQRMDALRKARIRLHILDAREPDTLAACLQTIQPDSIVHLAAIASVGATDTRPSDAAGHSLTTLVNVLEYVRRHRCHLVYASSSMVYGNFKSEAATEDDLCEPVSLYGALKLSGEQTVTGYAPGVACLD